MKKTLVRDANIIEAFIGFGLTIPQIVANCGLSEFAVKTIIEKYDKPVEYNPHLHSKVNLSNRHWFIFENWQKMPLAQIAEVLDMSPVTVKGVAYRYNFPKKIRNVINPVKYHYKHRATILNLETGIFYLSEKEAAHTINMNYSTLKNKLNGNRKNNTAFIKV